MKKNRHKPRQSRNIPTAIPLAVNKTAGTLTDLLDEIERRAESKIGNVSDIDEQFALLFDATPSDQIGPVVAGWKLVDLLAMGKFAEAKRAVAGMRASLEAV